MINAWNELIDKLKEINKTTQDIQWAKIKYCHSISDEFCLTKMNIYFPLDEQFNSFENFKEKLKNINYDNYYVEQYLFGFVVFTDNSWLERGYYEGFECWEYKRTPVFNYSDKCN